MDAHALTRSAGRGALWQLVGAGAQTVIQLGASAVLARVLFPSDFGIMGMALLAQSLVGRMGALGTSAGLIAKKDVTQEDLSTAFWTGVAVHGTLFALAFAGAPLAALFFETPSVTWVLRAMSFTFLFTAAGSVSGAILRKRLQFGGLKAIEVAAFALQSALAIVFAVVFGLGYWSLVCAMLIAGFGQTAAGILYARWRPSLRFSRSSFRFMFRYGINELGSSVVQYFQYNTDYILVGRILGPGLLGLYEFAYRIPHMLLDRLALPVGSVLFPALSKVQTDDERLAGGYIKAAKYIAIIVFPLLGGLAALAHPAVAVLWGEKWLPIVLPLQVLCLSAAIRCVMTSSAAIFLCRNRPDLPFKFGLGQMALTFAAVGALGYAFGLNGVALGMVISTGASVYVTYFALRMVHCPFRRLFRALWGPLAATVGCVAAAAGMRLSGEALHLPDWGILASSVPVGALAYIGILVVWFPDQVKEVWATVRLTLGKPAVTQPVSHT